MSLKEQLTEDMKTAMKAKAEGKQRLSVIRMVRSAVRQIEIDDKKELNDNEVIDIIMKEVKMRKDSIEEFKKGNRNDLVVQTEAEIAVLMPYLPQQLSEEELRSIIKEAVEKSGASSQKEMGKVMGLLMPKVKGRADGKLVNMIVRDILNS
ncbi:MAG: GatB/YqeY domain-containing protein [Selenomonadaceae bacterium]